MHEDIASWVRIGFRKRLIDLGIIWFYNNSPFGI